MESQTIGTQSIAFTNARPWAVSADNIIQPHLHVFTHFSLLRLSSQIMVISLKSEASPCSVLHHLLNSYIFKSKYFPQNFVLRRYMLTFDLPFISQLQKATLSFVMSIRSPVRLPEWKKTPSRTSWLVILLKRAETFRFCLQPDKETSVLQRGLRTFRLLILPSPARLLT